MGLASLKLVLAGMICLKFGGKFKLVECLGFGLTMLLLEIQLLVTSRGQDTVYRSFPASIPLGMLQHSDVEN